VRLFRKVGAINGFDVVAVRVEQERGVVEPRRL
jgi:hypothetical protein